MSLEASSLRSEIAAPVVPELSAAVAEPLPPYLVRLVQLMDRIERREHGAARSAPEPAHVASFSPSIGSPRT